MNTNSVSKRKLSRAAFASLIGIAALFLPALCRAQGYTITTFAGGVPSGACAQETDSEGDGCPATSASIGPAGIAVDSAGNLYIADSGFNLIRKVSTNGIISTIAGNVNTGEGGYSGDGGPAAGATVSGPLGLALDAAGNLYIADTGNDRIRKIANGIITTVAGGGLGCAQQTDTVGDGCPATSALLFSPAGVAVDAAGNLYVADTYNQRIRKAVQNGTITTVAGDGTYTLLPGSLGDGGPATSATLFFPGGVAVDSSENIYIADTFNNRIRKVANGIINTVAGNGSGSYSGDGDSATSAGLSGPSGIAVDSGGNLFIADTGDQRVREVTNGTITTIAGSGDIGSTGDGGPATSATLNTPVATAFGKSGEIFVSDAGTNASSSTDDFRVRLLTPLAVSPAILPTGGLLNGASFQAGIVPGSWLTIYGTNLSSTTDSWTSAIVNGKLPTSLDDVIKVSVGGEPAYISYISPKQIDAVVPNVGTGPVEVTVTNSNGTSSAVTATAQAVQPAFFQWPGSYAVATTLEYSLAVKNGTFPGATTTPAKPGEVIVLWGTGFGPTSPSAPVGVEAPSSPTYYTANKVTVTVGGKPATVYSAVLAPGFAGLYQVAILIPASLANGDYAVVATISGVQSPQTTLITVQD
jgi:uncharacterized protein (TIGR03437 family)